MNSPQTVGTSREETARIQIRHLEEYTEIVRLHESGLSRAHIAKKLALSEEVVRRTLRKSDFFVRNMQILAAIGRHVLGEITKDDLLTYMEMLGKHEIWSPDEEYKTIGLETLISAAERKGLVDPGYLRRRP